jgi:hypothetical protein
MTLLTGPSLCSLPTPAHMFQYHERQVSQACLCLLCHGTCPGLCWLLPILQLCGRILHVPMLTRSKSLSRPGLGCHTHPTPCVSFILCSVPSLWAPGEQGLSFDLHLTKPYPNTFLKKCLMNTYVPGREQWPKVAKGLHVCTTTLS